LARSFKNQLAGQLGEALVVAELGRRNVIATGFAGNVPDIDLLAYKDGHTIAVQVKAWRSGAVSFDAKHYLTITNEGDTQIISGIDESRDPDLIFVFVKIGEELGKDFFYLLKQIELQRIIEDGYTSFLNKHGGIRPRNPLTTHNSVTLEQLTPFKDNWSLIDESWV
jgi:hypothetical protein